MIDKSKTTAAVMLLLAVGSFVGHPAAAAGDAEAGAAIGYSCLGCHGIKGYRNAYPSYRVPKLGGQKESYLVIALQGYRAGMRAHPTMAAQASSLSDQQIEDVAAYIASLSEEAAETGAANGPLPDAAAACVACHGQNGIGLSPAWPTLGGQHEDYLAHALRQYRSGARNNAIMSGFASQLSDADIKLLAGYYASLDGLVTSAKK